MPQSIELLKSTLDRRLIRYLLKKFSSRCSKDGKSRVEVALELFVGARNSACWSCSHIVYPIVKWTLIKGSSSLGLSEEELKKRFMDPYWRRGLANVISGIAKFGVRRPFTPGAPFLIVWNYTEMCNLRCKHCYYSAGNKPGPNELTTSEALKVVDDLADAGVTIIAFSGGEPLMRKDIYEIMKRANDHGIFVAVATNGTLITKEVAEKLRKVNLCYVQISLDGANPETHDDFRGVPGAFEKTIRGIKNCVEVGIFTEVATTMTKINYGEIVKIIDLCEELGVDGWVGFNFIPTGRGLFIKENDLSPEEREEILKKMWLKIKSGSKLQVVSTAPQYARVALQMEAESQSESQELIVPTHFYNPKLHGQLISVSEFIGGCGAGRFYCAINADGTITPCVFFPLIVGNMKKDKFEEVWDTNQVFWDLRDRDKLKPHCGECEYKYVCGGCRARAYGYFGDYLAPDPGCINNLDKWINLARKSEVYTSVKSMK